MPDSDSVTADQASDAAQVDSGVSTPDASQRDSQPAVTSPATDSPASRPADAQTGADPRSLTAGNDSTATPDKPQIPSGYVPQRDLDNLKRALAQRQTENQRYQSQLQQYQGIDPATVTAFRKQQQEAQAAKLPQWSNRHPEHGQFTELKARWQQAQQTARRLTANIADQNEKVRIVSEVFSDFAPEQQRVMQDHAQHQRRFSERMAEDPEGTLAEMVESRVQNMLAQRDQQQQQWQQAEQSTGQWFQDQANAPILSSQREWLIQAMTPREQGGLGMPWTVARLEAENRFFRSQRDVGTAKVLSAEARTQLVRGNAAITRDPVTAPISDPYDHAVRTAKEKGITIGGPGWLDHVHSLGIT